LGEAGRHEAEQQRQFAPVASGSMPRPPSGRRCDLR
jgi:hypothetical protein